MSALYNGHAERICELVFDDVTQWYIAWGSANPANDDLPDLPERDPEDNALETHIAHLKATAQFVTPDEEGALSTASGERWTVSVTPTRYIFVEAPYDWEDGVGHTIRELAVYADATPGSGFEADLYLPAANLTNLGKLMTSENIHGLERLSSRRGSIALVYQIGEDAA